MQDGLIRIPYRQMFPSVPENELEVCAAKYTASSGGDAVLSSGSVLVQSMGKNILLDAGLGMIPVVCCKNELMNSSPQGIRAH